MFQSGDSAEVKFSIAWIGIIGSIIASVVSLITLYISQRTGEKNRINLEKHQRELEELKTTLQDQKSEKDARRDYEYEARKRLYQQCEPLLFQLVELTENARKRVQSLARTARENNLSVIPGKGWLNDTNNYYLASTVYKLLAPLVVYRLIQQRLTLVDLTLDPHINLLYQLSKRLFISFTDDFKFSKINPKLEYDCNAEVPPSLEQKHPEIYKHQAMFVGSLESIVDKLITETNGTQRCMNYGEFEAVYYEREGVVSKDFREVAELFLDFHPQTRPVFWRILVAQAHIHESLIRVSKSKMSKTENDENPSLMPATKTLKRKLNWRYKDIKTLDDEVPFDASEKYLREHLGDLFSSDTLSVNSNQTNRS